MDSIISIVMKARDEASKHLQGVSRELERTQARNQAASRSMQNNLALGANIAKSALMGLGGGALLLGGNLANLERDLEAAAAGIAGVSGAGSAAIPELQQQLKNLVGANDAAAKDITAALTEVYTSFSIFDDNDPDSIAQILIDWKEVTGQNFNDAALNFRTTVLTFFGKDKPLMQSLTELTDKTLAVAQSLGISPSGLATALADAAPIFLEVFGSLDSSLKFLGTFGAAGGNVEAAGKAIQLFLGKVLEVRDAWKNGQTPDQNTTDAFNSLGLNLETVQNEAILVGELLTRALKNAMLDGKLSLDEVKSLNFLFGDRIGTDMALVATNASAGFRDLDIVLKESNGRLATQAAVMDENVTSKITQAWNKMQTAIISSDAWNNAAKLVKDFIDTVTSAVNGDWTSALTSLGTMGNDIFRLLLGADSSMVAKELVWWWDNTVSPSVNTFIESDQSLESFNKSIGNPFGEWLFKTMLGASSSDVADALVYWWDNSVQPEITRLQTKPPDPPDRVFLTTDNLGLIIVKKLFNVTPEQLQTNLKAWWDGITTSANDWLATAVMTISTTVTSVTDELFIGLFGTNPQGVSDSLNAWWTKVKADVSAWVTQADLTIKTTANSVVDGLFQSLFGTNPQGVATTLDAWWTKVKTDFTAWLASADLTITTTSKAIGESLFKMVLGADSTKVADALVWWWDTYVIPEFTKFTAKPVDYLFSTASSIGKKFFDFLINIDPVKIAASIKTWWDNAVLEIAKFFTTIGGSLASSGGKIWEGIRDGATAAWNGTLGVAAWALNRSSSLLDELGKWLEPVKTWASGIWTSIKDGVSAAWNGTEGAVAWVVNRGAELLLEFGKWLAPLTTWAGKIWTSIKDGAYTAFIDASTGASAWVTNRWNNISKFFTDTWLSATGILKIGVDLMNGLITGMGNGWDAVWKKINEIGGDVLKTFKDIFGIKSPSLELKSIGEYIMQGLSIGLAVGMGGTNQQMEKNSAKLLESFKKLSVDLDKLFNTEYAQVFSSMSKTIIDTLTDLGVGMDPVLKANITAFAAYTDQFVGLLQKYKGNVLAALGDLLIGIIEQKVIELTIWGAVEVGKAAASGFLSFGATALLIPAILAAGGAAIAGLESIKGEIRNTYGSFAVGTPYVPHDQLAQIHQGEMIIPRTFADGIRNGEMSLGNGQNQQPIIQVWLDGRMVAEQVGNRIADGMRGLVRADFRTITG